MKVTKSQLQQILLEEISGDEKIVQALRDLMGEISTNNSSMQSAVSQMTATFDQLDTSIDYLAGAVTGQGAAGIEFRQAALGRFAGPGSKKGKSRRPDEHELDEMIREELAGILDKNTIDDV